MTARFKALLILVSFLMVPAYAQALPQNGTVAGGSATITQTSPTQLTITQATNRAVIDWNSFSIGKGETTTFNQPSATAVAVNRVTGVSPSQIMGNLNANGQVVLVNPHGILFDKSGQVNVGSLIASTASITTGNAMAGNLHFDQPTTSNTATIVNRGTITAAQGGLVALVAPGVANSGTITAKLGKIMLASGNTWTVDLYGDDLVSFAIDSSALPQVAGPDNTVVGVSNSGMLTTTPGTITLTVTSASDIVANATNQQGIVQADKYWTDGQAIILSGDQSAIYAAANPATPQTAIYTFAQPAAQIYQPGFNSSLNFSYGEGDTVSYVYNTWSNSIGGEVSGLHNFSSGEYAANPVNRYIWASSADEIYVYTGANLVIQPTPLTIAASAASAAPYGWYTVGFDGLVTGASSSIIYAGSPNTSSAPAQSAASPMVASKPVVQTVIQAQPAPMLAAQLPATGGITLSQVIKSQVPVETPVAFGAFAVTSGGIPCASARDCAAGLVKNQF